MQYILTEEEFKALKDEGRARVMKHTKKLQAFATLAANHIPVDTWRGEKRPWGCILDPETNPSYCDDCPSQEFCPSDQKEWSQ